MTSDEAILLINKANITICPISRNIMNIKNIIKNSSQEPNGELVLRTLAMPADTNANGDIFGGWLMSQMDIGGAILAGQLAKGRVVTVSVKGMSFLRPVAVGNVICCYARCIKRGITSLTINVDVWIRTEEDERFQATEAEFTYVAVDELGRPRSLPTCD